MRDIWLVEQATRIFLERLVEDNGEELRAFLWRRIPAAMEVGDAVQEVYLRLCRVNCPDAIRNPRAFLFQTATNVVADIFRKRRVQEVPMEQAAEAYDLPSDGPSPEQTLHGKEMWRAYCEALDELPPKCRQVFVMCRMQNRSHAEIGAEFNISIKMVEKYMTKALLHLGKRLDPYLVRWTGGRT